MAPLPRLRRGPQETGPWGVYRRTYTVPNACTGASLDHPQTFAVIEQQHQQHQDDVILIRKLSGLLFLSIFPKKMFGDCNIVGINRCLYACLVYNTLGTLDSL